eukprot:scaffold2364_cov426-Prasinococcus_capsulatus_cf.AAC.4
MGETSRPAPPEWDGGLREWVRVFAWMAAPSGYAAGPLLSKPGSSAPMSPAWAALRGPQPWGPRGHVTVALPSRGRPCGLGPRTEAARARPAPHEPVQAAKAPRGGVGGLVSSGGQEGWVQLDISQQADAPPRCGVGRHEGVPARARMRSSEPGLLLQLCNMEQNNIRGQLPGAGLRVYSDRRSDTRSARSSAWAPQPP